MIEVWINGFKYYADEICRILYVNADKQGGCISYRFLTANERQQLADFTIYNRKKVS